MLFSVAAPGVLVAELPLVAGVPVAEVPLVAFPRLFSLVAPGVPFPVAELPLVAAPSVPLATCHLPVCPWLKSPCWLVCQWLLLVPASG